MNENQPLWYVAFTAIGMGLIKLLDVLKIGDLLGNKAKADKECEARCIRLEMTVSKLHTTIKIVAQYLNNPENIESTKENLERSLKDIEPIIKEINNKSQNAKNE